MSTLNRIVGDLAESLLGCGVGMLHFMQWDDRYKTKYVVDKKRDSREDETQCSNLGKCLENGSLGILEDKPFPRTNHPAPFVIIRDPAVPLKKYLSSPYTGSKLENQIEKNYNLNMVQK